MKPRVLRLLLSVILLLSLIPWAAFQVDAAADLSASEDCIAVLKKMEGFCKYPISDYGQYSVGYGSRCPDEDLARYRANGITESEADKLLRSFLEDMEAHLNRFVRNNNLAVAQNQFDALLLLTYNIGTGWTSGDSDLKNAVLNGAVGNDLIFYMSRWCTADYQVLPALVKRRLAEADLFLNGNYSAVAPSYYSYVLLDPNGGNCTSKVQGYDASEPAAIKATPTNSGYRFLGWYTALEGGRWVTDLDTTVAETTLYARWQKDDGNVEDGKIQGTPASYQRRVNTTGALSAYVAPNDSEPMASMDPGVSIQIVADFVDSAGAKWGKMQGGGWVNLGTTLQEQKLAAKPVRENVTVTVTGTDINVREGAGTNYAVVGQVNYGDQLVIGETKMVGSTKWGKYSGGWISLEYTDYGSSAEDSNADDNTDTATGTVVNCTSLRIRSGAGTHYPAIGSLTAGTKVQISQQKSVGTAIWGQIEQGWICLSYVKLEDQLPEQTQPTPDSGNEEDSASDTQSGTVVNCTVLNVRSAAGTANKLVDTLPSGTKVEIYETQTVSSVLWGRIRQGWICMTYVRLDSANPENTAGTSGTVISNTSLNVRSGAGTHNSRVGSLPRGTQVTVYERTELNGVSWGRIDQGWVCLTYIRLEETASDTQTGSGSDDSNDTSVLTGRVAYTASLRIRSGAGTHNPQVGSLAGGTQVSILEQTMVSNVPWGRIDQGWISMNYVKLDSGSTGSTSFTGTVNAYSLRIRSYAGTTNSVVGYYHKGDQVTITETVVVNGVTWGCAERGWIGLSYVDR